MASKIKAKCLEIIRKNPGILRSELHKMGIGYRTTINLCESRLVYDGTIMRVWDSVMRSYRLYPRTKVPCIVLPRFYKKNLHSYCGLYFAEKPTPDLGEAHGDKFYRAFDEAFGILYIDLKIISGACGMIDDAQTGACKIAPTETGIDQDTPMLFLPVCRGVIPRGASFHQVSVAQMVEQHSNVGDLGSSPSGYIPTEHCVCDNYPKGVKLQDSFNTSILGQWVQISLQEGKNLYRCESLSVHGAGRISFQNITNHPVSCADYNFQERYHVTRGSFPEHDNIPPNGSGFQLFQTPPPSDYKNYSHPARAMRRLTECVQFDSCDESTAIHAVRPARNGRFSPLRTGE